MPYVLFLPYVFFVLCLCFIGREQWCPRRRRRKEQTLAPKIPIQHDCLPNQIFQMLRQNNYQSRKYQKSLTKFQSRNPKILNLKQRQIHCLRLQLRRNPNSRSSSRRGLRKPSLPTSRKSKKKSLINFKGQNCLKLIARLPKQSLGQHKKQTACPRRGDEVGEGVQSAEIGSLLRTQPT